MRKWGEKGLLVWTIWFIMQMNRKHFHVINCVRSRSPNQATMGAYIYRWDVPLKLSKQEKAATSRCCASLRAYFYNISPRPAPDAQQKCHLNK